MRTIYKYPISSANCEIEMPYGSDVLCVQAQNGKPHLWCEVDSDLTPVTRQFITFGTGHEMPTVPLKYIGTFQLEEGRLVFHVFERVQP